MTADAEPAQSVRAVCDAVRQNKYDLAQRVETYLQRAEEQSGLNCILRTHRDNALAQAESITQKIRDGQAGACAGAVVALKDNIAIKDADLTSGSHILEGFVSPYNATVVEKLLAQDAIILAQTNLDEFAMGSSNENSYFGPALHPQDSSRVPGGSSGGSAVAVAAELCDIALGSDTGGSIRQPAAFCGIYALKPTYGRVSRFGLVAFASSLDQIGPFARNLDDLALAMQTICGHDPQDSTSASVAVPDFSAALQDKPENLRVGLPAETLSDAVQPEIRAKVSEVCDQLKGQGAEIVDIHLDTTEYCIAAYYIICTAEASSNLARYDGSRYGYRAQKAGSLDEMYIASRSEGFGEEVQRRIMLGTYVLSAGYYDAYYRKAMQARTLIRRDFDRAFQNCDIILSPTTPSTAFKLGERTEDPISMYLSDVFTVSANLAGLPAMSFPAGKDAQGLPIGLQLIGKPFAETTLLQTAAMLA